MRTPAGPDPSTESAWASPSAYFGVVRMLTLIAFAVIGIDLGRAGVHGIARCSRSRMPRDGGGPREAFRGLTDPVGRSHDRRPGRTASTATRPTPAPARSSTKSLPGRWDFESGTFTANGVDRRHGGQCGLSASPTKTVTNFVAGAIGAPESSVHRYAIAAAGGACDVRTLMPDRDHRRLLASATRSAGRPE